MDSNDREDSGDDKVTSPVNVDLINHITGSIIETIFDWHAENNVSWVNFSDVAIAISASATSAMDFMNRRPANGELIQ